MLTDVRLVQPSKALDSIDVTDGMLTDVRLVQPSKVL